MVYETLMLQVNLPLNGIQSNTFVTSVKNKTQADSKLHECNVDNHGPRSLKHWLQPRVWGNKLVTHVTHQHNCNKVLEIGTGIGHMLWVKGTVTAQWHKD